MCEHRRLDDPNGVKCVRDHDDKGHVYHGTTVDDRHTSSEGMDD